MQRTMIAALGIAMILGCGKAKDEAKDDKTTGNPITSAKGPIGQGGDPAAMAVRRGAQQQKAMNDLKQLALFYNTFRAESATATTENFTKYLEGQPDARALVQAVKEAYVIQVPPGGTGLLAYEKDKDYQNTRVVVMTDGAVTKTMPEADFQAALKKGQ